jgi:Universal stress protein UspA and related nucleotide-binding proteins
MKNILLPVDGSENSMRAVNYTVDMLSPLPKEHCPVLHILNVQRSLSPNFDMLVREEDRANHYKNEGRKILDPIESILKLKNIVYVPHIVISTEIAHSIAEFAAERGCELIVMGTRGLGKIQGIMLGSMATKVVHESSVPVLLVK